jgi:hypothetical protein
MKLKDHVRAYRAFADEVASALAPLGFARGAGHLLASPVSEQVDAIVGLNKAMEADHIEINPVMGLRHKKIQALKRELLGLPELAEHAMTIGASLGYLMPEPRYRPIVITDEVDGRRAANDLAVEVERYGIPWVRKQKELAAIAQAVQSPPFNGEHLRVYTLPLAYFLLGDYGAAQRNLEERLLDLAGKNYPAAKQYRQFARALLAKLSAARPQTP